MEHNYKHYTGALVKIDSNGKKRILKDGIEFRTFYELKKYEDKKFLDDNFSYTQDFITKKK